MRDVSLKTWTDAKYLLHDKGIRNAIENGWINGSFPDSHIQPASLDLRNLKVRVYDEEVRQKMYSQVNFANFEEVIAFDNKSTDGDFINFAKVYEGYLNQKIPIPPGALAEIFVDLKSFDPRIFSTSVDLRSSRGRIHLDLDGNSFMVDSDGSLYLRVTNKNRATINLYGQDKFAQAFFHPYDKKYSCGEIVTDPKEAKELAKIVFENSIDLVGPYVVFRTGDKLTSFRREVKVIDTKHKAPKEDLYNDLNIGDGLPLLKGDTTIIPLEPSMKLPGNIGIQVLHDIPYYNEQGLTSLDHNVSSLPFTSCKAGWVDPGYSGKITAHPTIKRNMELFVNFPLAFGRFFKYYDAVDRNYGDEKLNSHYQNSVGSISRS